MKTLRLTAVMVIWHVFNSSYHLLLTERTLKSLDTEVHNCWQWDGGGELVS